MTTALATPFYLDMGFSLSDIGIIAKNVGLWASVVGGLLGGIWMLKIGINRGLWVFGVVQVVSILGFAWLAYVNVPDRVLLAVVIAFEALGVGLGTAAFSAIAHRDHAYCNPIAAAKIERMLELVSLVGDASVLDLGCGRGELSLKLVERFQARVTAVDISSPMLDAMRQRAQACGALERL